MRFSRKAAAILLVMCAGGYLAVLTRQTGPALEQGDMKVTTWNVAAVNNNPFEYWITGNEQYNALMQNFAEEIERPTPATDWLLKDYFTEEMAAELFAAMRKARWYNVDEVERRWKADLSNRKAITEFLKDKVIGKKRLISMFDRVTNTVATSKGTVFRPTPINCYAGDLSRVNVWWPKWLEYIFDEEHSVQARDGRWPKKQIQHMLVPITRAKYPSVTAEEEQMSIPLQTLHGAIFDTVLTNALYTIDREWPQVRSEMCSKLNTGKPRRTLDILHSHYSDSEVIFLQEFSGSMVAEFEQHALSSRFKLHKPAGFDNYRNQNSVILLQTGKWADTEELTGAALQKMEGGASPGDLLVLAATHLPTNSLLLLSSFHGDTNGLLSKPVLNAVLHTRGTLRKLIFGLDANTHQSGDATHQGVQDFTDYFVDRNLNSCWGIVQRTEQRTGAEV
eukprot:gene14536-22246_t